MTCTGPLTCSVLAGLVLLTSQAEAKTLKGQVLLMRDGGSKEPASPAMVSIVGIGNPSVTKLDGGFEVFVPEILQPQTSITLHVKFRNWVLSDPVEGELPLPENLDQTLVKILLVQKGAPDLQAPAHIGKVMEKTLEESLTQVTQEGKSDDIDPYAFTKKWAAEKGVPENVALSLVNDLKLQYSQSPDPTKRGIAAIFEKQLDRAAANFDQAASQKEQTREELLREIARLKSKKSGHVPSQFPAPLYAAWHKEGTTGKRQTVSLENKTQQLKAMEEELRRITEEIVEDLRKAGDAHYLNYKFEKAIDSYQKAFTYFTKEMNPTVWAALLINLGNANLEMAKRTEGAKIRVHFQETIKAYSQAQEVYARETFPQNWAATQMNLGIALSEQGTRATGADSQRLLAEGVAAYRAALEVLTRQTLPQDWARTQMNLGNALSNQGTRATGADSQRLL
nr:hypothetical protein [Nitrospirales bacterium]